MNFDKRKFDSYLKIAVEDQITDVVFFAEQPPLFRVNDGEWLPFGMIDTKVSEKDTWNIASWLLPELTQDDLKILRSKEVGYDLPGLARFRAIVVKQRQTFHITMRVIPVQVKTFQDLKLPEQIEQIASLKGGLVLVTGQMGQGKSTTIAAVVEHINKTRVNNIVTLEDPIECTFESRLSYIAQREIGDDVDDYASGIKDALRMRPDVLVVSEIRDKYTFEAALQAADTGVLVLSAIHTKDVSTTLSHILGFYHGDNIAITAKRLSNSLTAIISLRLLPCLKSDTLVIPACEIMRMTPTIAETIKKYPADAYAKEIGKHLEAGKDPYGMQTFDQHLAELYMTGFIDEETVKQYATEESLLDRIKTFENMPQTLSQPYERVIS